MLDKIVARNTDIIWRNIGGEAVLLNQTNGNYFGLNGVGCSTWEKIDGSRTVAEIVRLLITEYSVEEDILTRDVLELIDKLQGQGLLHLR